MDHKFGKYQGNKSHLQHDDWDEVHQQMIEVQKKNVPQKKSLAVSDPQEADEKEADEVARKVAGGESVTIHGAGGAVQRKVQRKPFGDDPLVTGDKVLYEVKADDKHPDLEQKRIESQQSNIVFDSALLLLNGKNQFAVGENICYPTFWFFIAYRTDAILNPVFGDYQGLPDAYFSLGGDLHVRADTESQAMVIASKWMTGAAGYQNFFWNTEELFLSAQMSEVVVTSTRDAAGHLKNAPENEQLKADLSNLEKYLSRGFWSGNWAVTDEDVDESLKILQTAYQRSEYDFAWLVLQLKEKDLMGNLMRNIGSEHVAKYPDVVIRLAYLRPMPKLGKDIKKLVKDTVAGTVWETITGKTIISGAANRLAELSMAKQNLDVADTLGAFFDIKYYEIYAIAQKQDTEKEKKKTKKKLRSILMDVYRIVDLILEVLFSETNFQSEWSQVKLESNDPTIADETMAPKGQKWKPSGTEVMPPIIWQNKEGAETDEMGAEKLSDERTEANTAQEPSEVRRSEKTRTVTYIAEKAHWFFFNLGNLMAENELVESTVQEVVAETRKIQEKRLTKGVTLPNVAILDDTEITNKITWLDLSKMWFWELGASRMNTIMFGADARTTKDIQQLSGVAKVIEVAKQRVLEQGAPEPFKATIMYDKAVFFDSVEKRNIPMNFLGSFSVNVDFLNLANGAASILLTATNQSDLESATRFRMRANPEEPSGPKNANKSVVDAQVRGSSTKLGGTLKYIWKWSVPAK